MSLFCGRPLRFFQPSRKFFQRYFSGFTVNTFLSGYLAPCVELLWFNPPCSDPGKAPLVFSAIDFEGLCIGFTVFPTGESTYALAGESLLVCGDVTVQGGSSASHRKIVATVFTNAQFDPSIDTFPKLIVNKIIDGLGI